MQLKRDTKVKKEENLQLKNLKYDSKFYDTASNTENDDLNMSIHPEKIDMMVFKCSVCYKTFDCEINLNTHNNDSHKKKMVVMVSRESDQFSETLKPIYINNVKQDQVAVKCFNN